MPHPFRPAIRLGRKVKVGASAVRRAVAQEGTSSAARREQGRPAHQALIVVRFIVWQKRCVQADREYCQTCVIFGASSDRCSRWGEVNPVLSTSAARGKRRSVCVKQPVTIEYDDRNAGEGSVSAAPPLQSCPETAKSPVRTGLAGDTLCARLRQARLMAWRRKEWLVSLVEKLKSRMSLPVIAAPMFIASNPDLVIAPCCERCGGILPGSECATSRNPRALDRDDRDGPAGSSSRSSRRQGCTLRAEPDHPPVQRPARAGSRRLHAAPRTDDHQQACAPRAGRAPARSARVRPGAAAAPLAGEG